MGFYELQQKSDLNLVVSFWSKQLLKHFCRL